jgi:hypothetical protein
MKGWRPSAIGILTLIFACSLNAQPNLRSSIISSQAPDPISCTWTAELAPEVVRSPVQMDTHAAYRIFVFRSDGTVGYRLRSEFPYAAFLSFAVYQDTLVYDARLDYNIEQDSGSINPFIPGELVNADNRSYTVTVLPEGTVPDSSMPNAIFMPRPADISSPVLVVLVQRIYLAEPKVKDRFGGVEAPTIEPFEVSTLAPASCPSGDYSAVVNQFGSFSGNFSQSPLPRNGKIEFYRPPVSMVPFADGDHATTAQDCTGYLMATVYPTELAVVRLPAIPTFFDNTHTKKKTVFEMTDVRYLSFGSYGASPLRASDNENVAGPDLKTLPDGSTAFVVIPGRLPRSLKAQVTGKANQLGYNVMPLADEGLKLYPFLIYRNKVAAPGFVGDIHNVACYQGPDFSQAPSTDAASPANMQQYAPYGVECSVLDFLYRGCGQYSH